MSATSKGPSSTGSHSVAGSSGGGGGSRSPISSLFSFFGVSQTLGRGSGAKAASAASTASLREDLSVETPASQSDGRREDVPPPYDWEHEDRIDFPMLATPEAQQAFVEGQRGGRRGGGLVGGGLLGLHSIIMGQQVGLFRACSAHQHPVVRGQGGPFWWLPSLALILLFCASVLGIVFGSIWVLEAPEGKVPAWLLEWWPGRVTWWRETALPIALFCVVSIILFAVGRLVLILLLRYGYRVSLASQHYEVEEDLEKTSAAAFAPVAPELVKRQEYIQAEIGQDSVLRRLSVWRVSFVTGPWFPVLLACSTWLTLSLYVLLELSLYHVYFFTWHAQIFELPNAPFLARLPYYVHRGAAILALWLGLTTGTKVVLARLVNDFYQTAYSERLAKFCFGVAVLQRLAKHVTSVSPSSSGSHAGVCLKKEKVRRQQLLKQKYEAVLRLQPGLAKSEAELRKKLAASYRASHSGRSSESPTCPPSPPLQSPALQTSVSSLFKGGGGEKTSVRGWTHRRVTSASASPSPASDNVFLEPLVTPVLRQCWARLEPELQPARIRVPLSYDHARTLFMDPLMEASQAEDGGSDVFATLAGSVRMARLIFEHFWPSDASSVASLATARLSPFEAPDACSSPAPTEPTSTSTVITRDAKLTKQHLEGIFHPADLARAWLTLQPSSSGGGGTSAAQLEDSFVTPPDLKRACLHLYVEKALLAKSLRDHGRVVESLARFCALLVAFVVACMTPWLLGLAMAGILSSLWTLTLSLTFVFGPAASLLFQSILFLFVTHPYDPGDRIFLDGENVFIHEVGLFTTSLLKWDNQLVYYPNAALLDRTIVNIRRSRPQMEWNDLMLDIGTSQAQLDALESRLASFILANPRDYAPVFASKQAASTASSGKGIVLVRVWELIESKWMRVGVAIRHASCFQDGFLRIARHYKFMGVLQAAIQDLGVSYQPIVLPVQLSSAASLPDSA